MAPGQLRRLNVNSDTKTIDTVVIGEDEQDRLLKKAESVCVQAMLKIYSSNGLCSLL